MLAIHSVLKAKFAHTELKKELAPQQLTQLIEKLQRQGINVDDI